jgi:2,3-bisphosphoglycerate-independent phosphoglycerate mutase
VHAHQDHIVTLAKLVSVGGVPVAIHAFLDGRDVPPKSAAVQMAKFEADIAGLLHTRIVTVCGRYYAMDRDKRWDRVQRAYEAMALGTGDPGASAQEIIAASAALDIGDEFVLPKVISPYQGMHDGDGVLMGNFRSDRAREILAALLDPAFDGFPRPRTIKFAAALGMVEYSGDLNAFLKTIFPPQSLTQLMGEIVSAAGKTQLRAAETEKYPHVTFFYNGGREEPYPGEERILVPSPKVATYDLQPEMAAAELTDKVIAAIETRQPDYVVINFANPDMVGHTGDLQAAIKAVETVDTCLGRLVACVERAGGAMLVTADHGNCELMRDLVTGEPHTAHTLNLVPMILVGAPAGVTGLKRGRLGDVAPTLLGLMDIPQPPEMTGESLLSA